MITDELLLAIVPPASAADYLDALEPGQYGDRLRAGIQAAVAELRGG